MKRPISSIDGPTLAYYTPDKDIITPLPIELFVKIIAATYHQDFNNFKTISKIWHKILTANETLSGITSIYFPSKDNPLLKTNNLLHGAYSSKWMLANSNTPVELYVENKIGLASITVSPQQTLAYFNNGKITKSFTLPPDFIKAVYHQEKLYAYKRDGLYCFDLTIYEEQKNVVSLDKGKLLISNLSTVHEMHSPFLIDKKKLYLLTRDVGDIYAVALGPPATLFTYDISTDDHQSVKLEQWPSLHERGISQPCRPLIYQDIMICSNAYLYRLEFINCKNGAVNFFPYVSESITAMAIYKDLLIVGFQSGSLSTLNMKDPISFSILHAAPLNIMVTEMIVSINVDDNGYALIMKCSGSVGVWDLEGESPKLLARLDELALNSSQRFLGLTPPVHYDQQRELLRSTLNVRGQVQTISFTAELPTTILALAVKYIKNLTCAEKMFKRLPSFLKEFIGKSLIDPNKEWRRLTSVEKGIVLFRFSLSLNVNYKDEFSKILAASLDLSNIENFDNLWERATIEQKAEAIKEFATQNQSEKLPFN